RRSRPGWRAYSAVRPSRLAPSGPPTAAPLISPARRCSCTRAPRRHSAPATGRDTERSLRGWGRCCVSCRPPSEAGNPKGGWLESVASCQDGVWRSTHTVKYHLAAVLDKLGVRSRTEAVSLGVRRGLVPL